MVFLVKINGRIFGWNNNYILLSITVRRNFTIMKVDQRALPPEH
jgi:hypothetical protein